MGEMVRLTDGSEAPDGLVVAVTGILDRLTDGALEELAAACRRPDRRPVGRHRQELARRGWVGWASTTGQVDEVVARVVRNAVIGTNPATIVPPVGGAAGDGQA